MKEVTPNYERCHPERMRGIFSNRKIPSPMENWKLKMDNPCRPAAKNGKLWQSSIGTFPDACIGKNTDATFDYSLKSKLYLGFCRMCKFLTGWTKSGVVDTIGMKCPGRLFDFSTGKEQP